MKRKREVIIVEVGNRSERLAALFPEVGSSALISDVLEQTKIRNKGTLKTYLWKLRDAGVMDLHIKAGHVVRHA